jgi:hypothetical protein
VLALCLGKDDKTRKNTLAESYSKVQGFCMKLLLCPQKQFRFIMNCLRGEANDETESAYFVGNDFAMPF